MMSLEVNCVKTKENVLLCSLRITQIVKENKICHIKLRYKVQDGKIIPLEEDSILDRHWRGLSVRTLGYGILMFFLKTRHVSSKEWTEFWYLKREKKDSLSYRMYNCGEKFIRMNALLHSGKKK
uniref:Uncharacterized protein n=1 Tax=viral metagenome TaxID=1070528 RepID=A0A6C0CGP4_9ZZZZ